MERPQVPSGVVIEFPSARDAGRLVAGVAAAARIIRELSEAGVSSAWLRSVDGQPIDAAAMRDVERLAGPTVVRIGEPPADESVATISGKHLIPAEALSAFFANPGHFVLSAIDLTDRDAAAEILRRTGKATDGPVSRWINRPLSRALSAILVTIPGFRPVHATVGTAALALMMFAALVLGGEWGLIVGALLFQAASIFDGVDGEVARATFRSSSAGAALDSAVDTATTFLFIVGLATNLASSGQEVALALAAWSVVLIAAGLALIRWCGGSLNLDQLKLYYRDRFPGSHMRKVMAFLTVISSRDFFALANAAMIVLGFPMGPLYGFAASTSVWILFVVGSVLAPQSPPLSAERT
jgi:CDP-L-myo-inositol myo-inositolphosphotransferase